MKATDKGIKGHTAGAVHVVHGDVACDGVWSTLARDGHAVIAVVDDEIPDGDVDATNIASACV